MPDFTSRDPLAPGFWDERFEQRFTPWDRGGVARDLRRFVDGGYAALAVADRPLALAKQPSAVAKQPPAVAKQPPAVLLPGCGSAYELVLMCEAGWEATAIDFSPVAVARARALAGPWADRVVEADFFGYAPARPLDLIVEQAFLCALPRARWPEVARHWATLLAAGRPPGRLLLFRRYAERAAVRCQPQPTRCADGARVHVHRRRGGQRFDSGLRRQGTLDGLAPRLTTHMASSQDR